MPVALKRLCSLILLLTVYSCQNDVGSDKKSVGINTVPEYSLRTGNVDEIANASGELSSLDVIQLSSEVSEAIGDVFQFAVIDSVGILLVNFYAETVCLVDFSGNLRWKIVPRDDDFRYYQSMEGCTYDMFSKRVLVYNQQKTYFFDLEGNPIDVQLSPQFDFLQLSVLSNQDLVYSAQAYYNPNFTEKPKQIFWVQGGEFKGAYFDDLPYAPLHSLTGGFPEFSRLNGNVLYHAALRDTFYRIHPPNFSPAFTFNFAGPVTSEEVMKMEEVRNKRKYFREEGIPYVRNLAADSETLVLCYKSGREHFLGVMDRPSASWSVNHHFLRFRERVFKAPYLYDNGYFLRVFPKYQVEHFAKIDASADKVSEAWKAELSELDESYEDRGEKYLYLLKL